MSKLIELSATFALLDESGEIEAMVTPKIRFEASEKETTLIKAYQNLKQLVSGNIPKGYTIRDATKNEIEEWKEENE